MPVLAVLSAGDAFRDACGVVLAVLSAGDAFRDACGVVLGTGP